MSIQELNAASSEDKHAYFTDHCLAYAAIIHLYFPFADDPESYEKCLRAARSIVTIIRIVQDVEYDFLDPIIGVRSFSYAYKRWNLTRICSLVG